MAAYSAWWWDDPGTRASGIGLPVELAVLGFRLPLPEHPATLCVARSVRNRHALFGSSASLLTSTQHATMQETLHSAQHLNVLYAEPASVYCSLLKSSSCPHERWTYTNIYDIVHDLSYSSQVLKTIQCAASNDVWGYKWSMVLGYIFL